MIHAMLPNQLFHFGVLLFSCFINWQCPSSHFSYIMTECWHYGIDLPH